MLNRIRIVLVNTSHPGNIGAAARAMKTMGLAHLVLVAPEHFPDAQATHRAAGADDLLQHAIVVPTLAEALKDCAWVIGASVRERKLARSIMNPRACAERIRDELPGTIALVFGRESSGLTNEELSLCHDQVSIPSNSDFSSLNLASAVQVLAYELRMASNIPVAAKAYQEDALASAEEVAGFYAHLQETLIAIDFLSHKQPKRLMERLQLLFNRSHLTVTEINILRGILKAVQNSTTVIPAKAGIHSQDV